MAPEQLGSRVVLVENAQGTCLTWQGHSACGHTSQLQEDQGGGLMRGAEQGGKVVAKVEWAQPLVPMRN